MLSSLQEKLADFEKNLAEERKRRMVDRKERRKVERREKWIKHKEEEEQRRIDEEMIRKRDEEEREEKVGRQVITLTSGFTRFGLIKVFHFKD